MQYRFSVFEVDFSSGELSRQGRRVRLQEQPLTVLQSLLERAGEVVTREELQARLWPEGAFVERDEGLNTAVKRLRDALGDSATSPRFVETLPRRGYRFIAPVEATPAPAPEIPAAIPSPLPVSSPSWRGRVVPAILLLVLAAVTLGLVLAKGSGPATPSGRVMLAVLPLDNLSGASADQPLVDGLTEEVIAQLGRLLPERLGVIARTSVMRYREPPGHIREIGRELGVEHVLTGSVRRAGDRVRVTAQLVQVADGGQLWSETWERPLADVFEVQREVARGIARALSLELLPGHEAALARAATDSTEAYQAYLAGRHALARGTAPGFEEAVAAFRRAVALDPGYALAHASLAETYISQVDFYFRAPGEAFAEAQAETRAAAALEPDLPEVQVLLAEVKSKHERTSEGVERAYRRAIELNPSYARAHQKYALYLMDEQRYPEAQAEIGRALTLDPLSPELHMNAGWITLNAGDPEGAVPHLEKALAVEPGYPPAYFFLCWTYRAQGRPGPALEAAQQSVETSGGAPKYVYLLGSTLAEMGRKDEAKAELAKLQTLARNRYVAPVYLERLEAETEGRLTAGPAGERRRIILGSR